MYDLFLAPPSAFMVHVEHKMSTRQPLAEFPGLDHVVISMFVFKSTILLLFLFFLSVADSLLYLSSFILTVF